MMNDSGQCYVPGHSRRHCMMQRFVTLWIAAVWVSTRDWRPCIVALNPTVAFRSTAMRLRVLRPRVLRHNGRTSHGSGLRGCLVSGFAFETQRAIPQGQGGDNVASRGCQRVQSLGNHYFSRLHTTVATYDGRPSRVVPHTDPQNASTRSYHLGNTEAGLQFRDAQRGLPDSTPGSAAQTNLMDASRHGPHFAPRAIDPYYADISLPRERCGVAVCHPFRTMYQRRTHRIIAPGLLTTR